MVQTPFMLGTNVTRIFCNPISNVPKSKRALLALLHIPPPIHTIKWFHGFRHLLCFDTDSDFPKEKVPYWHYYTFLKNVVSWFRHLLCLVLMLLGFFVIPFQMFPKARGPY